MEQKSILIVGPQGSGKTTRARMEAAKFGKAVEIYGEDFLGGFAFSDCDAETKCIIVDGIDGFQARRILERVKRCASHPFLVVHRKYQRAIEVPTPRFIVTIDQEILKGLDADLSQQRYFNVISVKRRAA